MAELRLTYVTPEGIEFDVDKEWLSSFRMSPGALGAKPEDIDPSRMPESVDSLTALTFCVQLESPEYAEVKRLMNIGYDRHEAMLKVLPVDEAIRRCGGSVGIG